MRRSGKSTRKKNRILKDLYSLEVVHATLPVLWEIDKCPSNCESPRRTNRCAGSLVSSSTDSYAQPGKGQGFAKEYLSRPSQSRGSGTLRHHLVVRRFIAVQCDRRISEWSGYKPGTGVRTTGAQKAVCYRKIATLPPSQSHLRVILAQNSISGRYTQKHATPVKICQRSQMART